MLPTAGARNPALVVPTMEPLMTAMDKVRGALLKVMAEKPGLADCHLACGEAPARAPPREDELDSREFAKVRNPLRGRKGSSSIETCIVLNITKSTCL